MSKKEAQISIPKKNIRIGLLVIVILILAAVFVIFVLPVINNNGVISVRVEAGKMECKTQIGLLDSKGKPMHEMKILTGTPELMANSPYSDPKLVKSLAGVRYTFLPAFEEVVRVERATGKETVEAIAGTYRYCFITSATTVPGTYELTAQVTFYNSSSEDASPVAVIQIPYKLEVVPASK